MHRLRQLRQLRQLHQGLSPDALTQANDDCGGCHPFIERQWSDSMHRRAYVDPMFRRALGDSEDPACRSCHAPSNDPWTEPSQAMAHMGIGCVSCHAYEADGSVLSAREAPGAAHPVRVDARFASNESCLGCHDFNLPEGHAERVVGGVQTTGSEHAISRHADRSCIDCHMPRIEGPMGTYRSHSFEASRSEEMLREALEVAATRDEDGRIFLRLSPGFVGHAFPTGEAHRRLLVIAETLDGDEWIRKHRVLSRRLERGPQGLVVVEDDRPGAPGLDDGSVTVRFDLGARALTLPIRWKVFYQRTEGSHRVAADGVVQSIEVAGGLFEPVRERAL